MLIFAVMMLGITGVNAYTAPIIAANGSAAVYEPLLEVMPDAQDFELLYDAADPAASTLTDVPETVQGLYRETSGLGYVIRLSTTKGYTGEPIELTMAVDSEGKISGIKLNAFPDSKHLGEDYPDSYLGQDSAPRRREPCRRRHLFLQGLQGEAVEDGFAVLTANSPSPPVSGATARSCLSCCPASSPAWQIPRASPSTPSVSLRRQHLCGA